VVGVKAHRDTDGRNLCTHDWCWMQGSQSPGYGWVIWNLTCRRGCGADTEFSFREEMLPVDVNLALERILQRAKSMWCGSPLPSLATEKTRTMVGTDLPAPKQSA